MRPKKFKPGKTLKTIQALVNCHDRGDWVYLLDRPKHPSFLINMTVAKLLSFLHSGSLKKAIRTGVQ